MISSANLNFDKQQLIMDKKLDFALKFLILVISRTLNFRSVIDQ